MIIDVLAQAAASFVVVVHLAFLAYVVVGGFLALRRFALIWPSVAVTVYAAVITIAGFQCPLTILEKWLLVQAGRTPYEGSFISHYLRGVLYPGEYEIAAWLVATGIALSSYALALTRRRTARRALAADLPSTPAPAA